MLIRMHFPNEKCLQWKKPYIHFPLIDKQLSHASHMLSSSHFHLCCIADKPVCITYARRCPENRCSCSWTDRHASNIWFKPDVWIFWDVSSFVFNLTSASSQTPEDFSACYIWYNWNVIRIPYVLKVWGSVPVVYAGEGQLKWGVPAALPLMASLSSADHSGELLYTSHSRTAALHLKVFQGLW